MSQGTTIKGKTASGQNVEVRVDEDGFLILSSAGGGGGLTDTQLRATPVDVLDANKKSTIPYAKIRTANDTITPTSGKRIKLLKVQVLQNPDNTAANPVTMNFASIGDFLTGWAYSDSNEVIGAVNEVLNITLGTAQPVSVIIRYKEIV